MTREVKNASACDCQMPKCQEMKQDTSLPCGLCPRVVVQTPISIGTYSRGTLRTFSMSLKDMRALSGTHAPREPGLTPSMPHERMHTCTCGVCLGTPEVSGQHAAHPVCHAVLPGIVRQKGRLYRASILGKSPFCGFCTPAFPRVETGPMGQVNVLNKLQTKLINLINQKKILLIMGLMGRINGF